MRLEQEATPEARARVIAEALEAKRSLGRTLAEVSRAATERAGIERRTAELAGEGAATLRQLQAAREDLAALRREAAETQAQLEQGRVLQEQFQAKLAGQLRFGEERMQRDRETITALARQKQALLEDLRALQTQVRAGYSARASASASASASSSPTVSRPAPPASPPRAPPLQQPRSASMPQHARWAAAEEGEGNGRDTGREDEATEALLEALDMEGATLVASDALVLVGEEGEEQEEEEEEEEEEESEERDDGDDDGDDDDDDEEEEEEEEEEETEDEDAQVRNVHPARRRKDAVVREEERIDAVATELHRCEAEMRELRAELEDARAAHAQEIESVTSVFRARLREVTARWRDAVNELDTVSRQAAAGAAAVAGLRATVATLEEEVRVLRSNAARHNCTPRAPSPASVFEIARRDAEVAALREQVAHYETTLESYKRVVASLKGQLRGGRAARARRGGGDSDFKDVLARLNVTFEG